MSSLDITSFKCEDNRKVQCELQRSTYLVTLSRVIYSKGTYQGTEVYANLQTLLLKSLNESATWLLFFSSTVLENLKAFVFNQLYECLKTLKINHYLFSS